MTAEALFDDGTFGVRGLVKFQFGTGTYGATNASQPIEYGGLTYIPNALLQVQEPAFQMGAEASPLTIEMPESADFGITPDVLAQIENEAYKGAPVTIYDAYFDVDGALVHVEPLYSGFLDTIDHIVEDGQMRLVGNVMTSAIDNHRDGYRSASNADQQLVSAGDMFFEHASRVQTETFKITLD